MAYDDAEVQFKEAVKVTVTRRTARPGTRRRGRRTSTSWAAGEESRTHTNPSYTGGGPEGHRRPEGDGNIRVGDHMRLRDGRLQPHGLRRTWADRDHGGGLHEHEHRHRVDGRQGLGPHGDARGARRDGTTQTAPTRVAYLDVLGRETMTEVQALDPA
ncbi:MAG: hypothetical protein F4169_04300, partial [Gammaproteobacteria bacterium]|nr:hypothetical protein [Gammaproteobacteria bacterium]